MAHSPTVNSRSAAGSDAARRPRRGDGGDDRAAPVDPVRLLWASSEAQRIRGLWWPRGRDLAVELARLLPEADGYLGEPLRRVSANPESWDHQPHRLHAGSRVIRVAWFRSIDPATVAIGATPTGRIMLCVVPSEWGQTAGDGLFDALRTTAVWPDEPEELLGCGARPDKASAR